MSIETIVHELSKAREEQKVKWAYSYSVTANVQNGSTQPVTIAIGADAAFQCVHITGKAFGPVDSAGVWQNNAGPRSDFPVFGDTRFAQSGLSFLLTDQGSGAQLFNDYVPVETILTPGYGLNFNQPFQWRYLFRPSAIVRFDVRNRDTNNSGTQYHTITITMHGYKYMASLVKDAQW